MQDPRKIYDSSENLIGSIGTLVDTRTSWFMSLKDKNGNAVLYGKFHGGKNTPYYIYDNHKNVIAQITITEGVFTKKWNLHVLEPSYDRALLLCLFCVVFYDQTLMRPQGGG